MHADSIRKLFEEVRKGKLSPDEAVERLRYLPFEDLEFAKVDHHRLLRVGMPAAIFGQAKTRLQVALLFTRLATHAGDVSARRGSGAQFAAVKKNGPKGEDRVRARA